MATTRKPLSLEHLPEAVKQILAEYMAFVTGGPAQDETVTKAFAARHAAGRGALSHAEQLIKLAGESIDATQMQDILKSLTEWRAMMPPLAKEDPEADGDTDGGHA